MKCIDCKYAAKYTDSEKVLCIMDIDLRKSKIDSLRPSWCPLINKSELDYIKSC